MCVCVCARHRELVQAASTQELDCNRGRDAGGQLLEPSVGEDRAILSGFGMMAFSGLMLFVVGVTTVKPYLSRYCQTPTSQFQFLFWRAQERPWQDGECCFGCCQRLRALWKTTPDC